MTAPENPRVSVCVLAYNHGRYIRECLQSIVDQETGFPFEVIVGDDRSSDSTRTVVEEFGRKYPDIVRPVLRPVNIGGTQNFLDTHNRARGTYVAHMDGDDLMLPGKLRRQAEFLDANPDFAAVWHRINLINDEGRCVPGENFDLSFFPGGVITLDHAMRLGYVGAHSSLMYRRRHRKTFSADFEVLDLFYTWEYLAAGKGKMLDEVLGSYRVSAPGSIQLTQMTKVKRLIVHHARHYLRLMPEQKRNIFVLAMVEFLVDLKNRRRSAWDAGRLALEAASIVSPRLIVRTIKELQRMPPCSPLGNVHFGRAEKKAAE